MKRAISFILLISVLLCLCGCSESVKEFSQESVSGSFLLESDGAEYVGELTFSSNKPMSIELQKPVELSGVALTVRPEGVTFDCDGLSFDASSDIITTAFPKKLYGVLSELLASDITVEKNGVCERTLEYGGQKYSCFIDCDNNRLSRISSENFNAEFYVA